MKAVFQHLAKTRAFTLALVAGLGLLGETGAHAGPALLDFTIPPSNPDASISYAGGTADLVGSNIVITQVQGLGAPINDYGFETISNGSLNFTTGAFAGNIGADTWVFGAAGADSVFITGGVPSLGIADGSTLLVGQMIVTEVISAGDTFKVAISVFATNLNSTLAAAYGLAGMAAPWTGYLNVSLNGTAFAPDTFSSTQVFSGDVAASVVPEPSSLVLGCIGVLGVAGYSLKRSRSGLGFTRSPADRRVVS